MKKTYLYYILFIGCFLATLCVNAQNIPVSQTVPAPTQTVNPLPTPYTSATWMNYVRSRSLSAPVQTTAAVDAASTDAAMVKEETAAIDQFGRTIQSIKRKFSLDKDLIIPFVYDYLGRQQYVYKPYISGQGTGEFQLAPFADQAAFMTRNFSGEKVYYEKTEFEATPLSRTVKSLPLGNSWAGSARGTSFSEEPSLEATSIVKWDISFINGAVPVSKGFYTKSDLVARAVINEDQKRVITYSDKKGNIVLKKVEVATTPPAVDAYTGWLSTYYVYDVYNRLRYVIQPKGTAQLQSAAWAFDATSWSTSRIAKELCFSYEYDERGLLAVKRLPGGSEIYGVFDTRGRLVMEQDPNNRQIGRWKVLQYDGLNRLIREYLWNNTTAFATHAANAANSVVYPASGDLTTAELLKEVYYDDYNWVAGSSSGLSATLDNTQLAGGFIGVGESVAPYPTVMQANYQPRGMQTGLKIKILGTSNYLYQTTFFNNELLPLQVSKTNLKGGKDVTTNQYSFDGKLLVSKESSTYPGSTPAALTLITSVTYDANGRMLTTSKQLNGAAPVVVATHTYDSLGRLSSKKLGNIETLVYGYNIQDKLISINKDYVDDASKPHFFGMELGYDYGFSQNDFTGNISGIKWRGSAQKDLRAYGFGYDPAQRLMKADFTQFSGGAWNQSAGNNFDVKMGNGTDPSLAYDDNGNILKMQQWGYKTGGSAPIDNLTYTYFNSGNKLQAVTDQVTTDNKLGDFTDKNPGAIDYGYDANGNLVTDLNKGIQGTTGAVVTTASAIVYNYLNLPAQITLKNEQGGNKGNIIFTYAADGTKLKKVVTDNTTTTPRVTTTLYLGNNCYENDSLRFISHVDGRIRMVTKPSVPATFEHDYFVKDHLGNIRQVLTTQTDLTMYAATMESSRAEVENALFSNINETRVAKPVGYPSDENSAPNALVSKLNAANNGRKIGPSIVLKVMAGDTVQIGAKAFYKSSFVQGKKSPLEQGENILADLIQTFGAASTDGSIHGTSTGSNQSPFTPDFYNNDYKKLMERKTDVVDPDRPKAYLNFVLFDDQFKFVDDNSGIRQVKATPDQLQTLSQDRMVIKKSGFLYVYTSNESPQDVFFDNVALAVNSGPLLEETHYYPFGLTMSGINSSALKGSNYPENRKKYNGIEFTNELDLNSYDAHLRNLDPQIGRWWQIDPKIDNMEMWSPYASNFDNPVKFSDPNGDFPWILIPIIIGLVTVSQPAVAPTGRASDAPAIKTARDNAGIQTIASFAPGGLKPLASVFRRDPVVVGGKMDELPKKPGFDRHEIPSASSLKNTGKAGKGEAPAVQTPTPLHAETASFGGVRSARDYRLVEEGLLNQGKFEEAFKMGVDNLRVVMKDNPQMLKDANVTAKDMEKGIKQMENYFREVLLPKLQEGLNK